MSVRGGHVPKEWTHQVLIRVVGRAVVCAGSARPGSRYRRACEGLQPNVRCSCQAVQIIKVNRAASAVRLPALSRLRREIACS